MEKFQVYRSRFCDDGKWGSWAYYEKDTLSQEDSVNNLARELVKKGRGLNACFEDALEQRGGQSDGEDSILQMDHLTTDEFAELLMAYHKHHLKSDQE